MKLKPLESIPGWAQKSKAEQDELRRMRARADQARGEAAAHEAGLAKARAHYAPIVARLERLEKLVDEIGRQPLPPPALRKIAIEPEPAADPAYDAIADLLQKAARAGLGREYEDAASIYVSAPTAHRRSPRPQQSTV